MALFIGPFWVLLCIFWLNSVVFWGNSWLVFNADVLQRFFIQFLNFLKDLQKFCLKRLFVISQFCLANFTPAFSSCSVCPLFRCGAISGMDGWDGLGWDLCVGLLYEHRFAMLTRSSAMNIAPWINYKWYDKWIDWWQMYRLYNWVDTSAGTLQLNNRRLIGCLK